MRLLALLMPILAAATLQAVGVDVNNDGRIDVLWVVPAQPDGSPIATDRAAAAIQTMAARDQHLPFAITVVTNTCETLAGAAWFPEGRGVAKAVADPRFDAVIFSERAATLADFSTISYAGISALRAKLPHGVRPLLHLRGEITPRNREILRRIADGIRADIISEDLIRENNRTSTYTEAFIGPPEAIDDYFTAASFYSLIFRNRLPPFLEPESITFTERHQRILAQMVQKTGDLNRRPTIKINTWSPPAKAPAFTAPSLAKGTQINETRFLDLVRQSANRREISLPVWPVFLESIAPSPLWREADATGRKEAIDAMEAAMRSLLGTGVIEAVPADASPLKQHCVRSGVDFLLRALAFNDEANAVVITRRPLAFHLWRPPVGAINLRIATLNPGITFTPDNLTFNTTDFATPHPVEITRKTDAPANLLWSIHAATFPGIRTGTLPLP